MFDYYTRLTDNQRKQLLHDKREAHARTRLNLARAKAQLYIAKNPLNEIALHNAENASTTSHYTMPKTLPTTSHYQTIERAARRRPSPPVSVLPRSAVGPIKLKSTRSRLRSSTPSKSIGGRLAARNSEEPEGTQGFWPGRDVSDGSLKTPGDRVTIPLIAWNAVRKCRPT